MKTRKILAVLLALVLCVGALAACEAAPAETTVPPAGTTAPAEGTTAPAETEPADYSFEGKTLDVHSVHDLNDLPLDGFIQDAIGLDVKWHTPSDEQVNALMTDKVTPSLLFRYGPSYGHEMGRYGAFVNLYDYRDIMTPTAIRSRETMRPVRVNSTPLLSSSTETCSTMAGCTGRISSLS